MTVTVDLSQVWGVDVQVPYTITGTASRPADHDLANGTATILAGDTSEDIVFNVVNDADVEMTETVVITMGAPVNASAAVPSVHTVSITSEELPTVFFDTRGQTVAEDDDTVTVQASLSAPISSNVTVPITSTGMATNPADHDLAGGASILITAGNSTGSIVINLVDDTVEEASEPLVLTMGAPTNATRADPAAHRIDITDTDNCAATETGTVYYIDYTDGNDGDVGTSPATAWKTFNNPNAGGFTPGDKILFQRGEAWLFSGTLTPASSGAVGNPIVFGSYGCGNKPLLRGSVELNPALWVNVAPNKWYWNSAIGTDPRIFTHDGILGQRKMGTCTAADTAILTAQWDYCYSSDGSNFLRVFSSADPSTLASALRVPDTAPAISVTTQNNLVFKDLDVREFREYGFHLSDALNVRIDNVQVGNVGATGILFRQGSEGSVTNSSIFNFGISDNASGEGVHVIHGGGVGPAGPVDVENVTFTMTSPHDAGAVMDGFAIAGFQGWLRNVRWNTISGANGRMLNGIFIGETNPATGVDTITIEDNVLNQLRDNGMYIFHLGTGGTTPELVIRRNRITDSSIGDVVNHSAGIFVEQLTAEGVFPVNPVISHNIIDTTPDGTKDHNGITLFGGTGGISLSNNVIFEVDNAVTVVNSFEFITAVNNIIVNNRENGFHLDLCCGGGTTGSTFTFNDVFGNAGADYSGFTAGAGSQSVDPLFVDSANGDFTLQSTSTLIDAGTSLGFTRDIDHNPVPLGGSADIGAHEQ